LEHLIHARGVYDSDHKVLKYDGLLLNDGIILQVAPFATLRSKNTNAPVLDMSDLYIFPGLINTHVHLEFDSTTDFIKNRLSEPPEVRVFRSARQAEIMLLSGVTTIRDAGGGYELLSLKNRSFEDLYMLPRMHISGPPITITGGHLHYCGGEADSMDEVVQAVRQRSKVGCDSIKIVVSGGQATPGSLPERESYSEEFIAAMTLEARCSNLKTFCHCLNTKAFVNSMRGGVDCIDHCACFVRNHENGLLERFYQPEIMEEFRGERRFFGPGLSTAYRALSHCRNNPDAQTPRETFLLLQEQKHQQNFLRYLDLGLTPVVATDAGARCSYFDETFLELELMVEKCGLSPEDAIDAATINGAACMGFGNITGKIATGFCADLIAMKENPLDNIRAFRKIEHVFYKGTLVKEKTKVGNFNFF
jgi:imidazolonepropionase-like amidohydrolase